MVGRGLAIVAGVEGDPWVMDAATDRRGLDWFMCATQACGQRETRDEVSAISNPAGVSDSAATCSWTHCIISSPRTDQQHPRSAATATPTPPWPPHSPRPRPPQSSPPPTPSTPATHPSQTHQPPPSNPPPNPPHYSNSAPTHCTSAAPHAPPPAS